MSQPFLNYVSPSESIYMVGLQGIRDLEKMVAWLIDGEPTWRARIAPSIVVQSEVELFGVAMPRFAIRYYLGDLDDGFINLRRIQILKEQVDLVQFSYQMTPPGNLRHPDLYYYPYDSNNVQKPGRVAEESSCIADAVLQPPARLKRDFHIIQAPLGIAYGETWGKDFCGTPYMKHIHMAGGGLCAQAVCFMASCLRYNDATQIYGLAGITSLAAGTEHSELCISGLTYEEMMRYFNRAGLNCMLQQPRSGNCILPGQHFAKALRAYLFSNMPVIVPVDAGRLSGRFFDVEPQRWDEVQTQPDCLGIYESNRIPLNFPFNREAYPHVVLLVGASVKGDQFVVNDPLAYPFMTASAVQLWRAANYDHESALTASGGLRDRLAEQIFMPVTPGPVKVPLLGSHTPASPAAGVVSLEDGLIPRFEKLCGFFADFPELDGTQWLHRFDHLRLIQVNSLIDFAKQEPGIPRTQSFLKNLEQVSVRLTQGLPREDKHWIWVHWVKISEKAHALYVYDAEKELPPGIVGASITARKDADYINLRCAMLYDDNILRRTTYYHCSAITPGSETDNASKAASQSLAANDLKLSLITSFNINGITNCATPKGWPQKIKVSFAEMYCFMQWDRVMSSPKEKVGAQVSAPADLIEKLCQLGLETKDQNDRAPLPFLADLKTEIQQSLPESLERIEKFLMRRLDKDQSTASGVPTAIEWAADRADNHMEIASAAEEINNYAKKIGVELIALATFLPEIASSAQTKPTQAADAFRFLVRLSSALRLRGQPIKAIEIVGGSLIDGVWPAFDRNVLKAMLGIPENQTPTDQDFADKIGAAIYQDKDLSDAKVYGANLIPPNEGIRRLINVLAPAAEIALSETPPLFISAEMQPGPFYVLGDYKRVKDLCEQLDTHLTNEKHPWNKIARILGLNLDIPHWAILGTHDFATRPPRRITVNDAKDGPVFRRIVHAHISDHGRGHFCDNVLGSHNPTIEETFGPWIQLLNERVKYGAAESTGISFSGYVSIEMEAVKALEAVEECLDQCRRLGFR